MIGGGFMWSIINIISILSTVEISNCELYSVWADGPWTIYKKFTKPCEEIPTDSTLYWLNKRKQLIWKKK